MGDNKMQKEMFYAKLQEIRALRDELYQKMVDEAKEHLGLIFAKMGLILTDNDIETRENGDLVIVWDGDTKLFLSWRENHFPVTGENGVYLYNPETTQARWVDGNRILEFAELVGEEV